MRASVEAERKLVCSNLVVVVVVVVVVARRRERRRPARDRTGHGITRVLAFLTLTLFSCADARQIPLDCRRDASGLSNGSPCTPSIRGLSDVMLADEYMLDSWDDVAAPTRDVRAHSSHVAMTPPVATRISQAGDGRAHSEHVARRRRPRATRAVASAASLAQDVCAAIEALAARVVSLRDTSPYPPALIVASV
jgi:hypothetical protein